MSNINDEKNIIEMIRDKSEEADLNKILKMLIKIKFFRFSARRSNFSDLFHKKIRRQISLYDLSVYFVANLAR